MRRTDGAVACLSTLSRSRFGAKDFYDDSELSTNWELTLPVGDFSLYRRFMFLCLVKARVSLHYTDQQMHLRTFGRPVARHTSFHARATLLWEVDAVSRYIDTFDWKTSAEDVLKTLCLLDWQRAA